MTDPTQPDQQDPDDFRNTLFSAWVTGEINATAEKIARLFTACRYDGGFVCRPEMTHADFVILNSALHAALELINQMRDDESPPPTKPKHDPSLN